ncbi:MAG: hypothetical protein F4124_09455 [Acidimicrobiia bacterium]|nr:hypothetical protein [Acidimicrobiia bacterium]MYB08954.1 hypothetical protein [Acidimicrobiia bacterium]MYB74596.1 hypothetical protein [Acidimicrobiia bacterium]MYG57327.1 hypothetical protein [Acidimicrobiia bacterium]MYH99640.1 hypothetical protein [Acidimicrobiia bacterium]
MQRGGVYILFGGVVSAVGRALKPGVLVDSVDWNDLDGLVQAMADNEVLTHTSAVMYAFGLMFVLTGLNSVRNFVTDQGLVGDMVRGGTLLGMISLFVISVIQGLDHMAVRVIDDGIGSNPNELAVSLQSAKLGLILMAWPILYASIGVAGLGGMRLLPGGLHRSIQGIASLVMLATSVLLLMAASLESNDFWNAVSLITAIVLAIWIITLSHAVYKGKVSASTA